MRAGDVALLALSNLWLTRFRAVLTTLGVVIGIGVLVSMVSFGTGVQKNVTDEIKKNDLLTTLQVLPSGLGVDDVFSGNVEALAEAGGSGPKLDDEVVDFVASIPGVVVAYPDVRLPARLRFRGAESSASLRALPAALGSLRPYDGLPHGSFFTSDSEPSIVITERILADLGYRIEGRAALDRVIDPAARLLERLGSGRLIG